MSPVSQNRRFSFKLFKYILIEFSFILFCCLATFLTLFLIGALFDDLDHFLRNNAKLADTIRYFLLIQPEHLLHCLPMSLLMATTYVLSQLSRNNEMTAMRASGISILQTSTPLWGVAVLLVILHFFVGQYVAPAGKISAENLKERISDPYRKRARKSKAYLAFRNQNQYRDWFFENFQADGVSKNVRITQFRPDGSVSWELFAKEALYTGGRWKFNDALLRRFDDDGYFLLEVPQRSPTLEVPSITEDPKGFLFVSALRPIEEMSAIRIHQILRVQGASFSANTITVLKSYFYYHVFWPLSCLVAVMLGIPLSLAGRRDSAVGNFVKAALVLALYYVAVQFFLVLGKNHVIPPVLAGAIPVVCFLGYGLWGLRKMM